jgi:hypothetical protein
MITIKKNNTIKTKKNKTIKTKKNKSIKKIKTHKKYKPYIKNKTIKTQYGKGIFNAVSGQIFSNTGKRNLSYRGVGSKFAKKSKTRINYLTNGKKKTDLLNIFYAYKTPYQININKSSLNTIYESSKVSTAPYIRVDNHNKFLFVIILPALTPDSKPKLLWAVNFKNRVQHNKIISYSLPNQPINTTFKLLFKLYRYPDNVTKLFSIKNNMTIKRKKAMRKLNKYLIKKNMLNNVVANYSISVRQDKNGISNDFFKL